jgi:hypothetical protein
METVVNGVKGRAVGNKPLARSLARVKELMYDADDVVDELDYCRLQHRVQGGMYASNPCDLCVCVFFLQFFLEVVIILLTCPYFLLSLISYASSCC